MFYSCENNNKELLEKLMVDFKSLIHNTNLRMLACAESTVTKYFSFIK